MRVVEFTALGGLVSIVEIRGDNFKLKIEYGSEQAYLDMSAFVRDFAANKTGEDALCSMDARIGICQRKCERHGRLVCIAIEPSQSGERLYQQVLSWLRRPGAGSPVAAYACVYKARVQGMDFVVSKTELIHDARAKTFDENVCLGNELFCHSKAFRAFGVELDALLIAVDGMEIEAVTVRCAAF